MDMKNTVLFLLLLLGMSQLSAQTGLHVGFMGGPQYTMMLNDQPLQADGKGFKYVPTFGRTGTFKLGYNFVPPIGVAVGVTYSEQGQDYTTVDSVGFETRTSRRATYIKVPILLHMSSAPGPVMFVMEIGPQFGLLRDASISFAGITQNYSYPTTLLWKATDIEFAWALGAEFCVTKGVHFVLQHRGDYGILDFENKAVSENGVPFYAAERRKANNLTLSIVGGMNFVIKGAHSKTTRHYKGRTWRNNWR
jgi:hypothetical protein